MSWMLIAAAAWAAVAVALALLIGRSIHHADQVDRAQAQPPAPDFMPAEWPARVPEAR